jgi:hypothetical protein
VLPRVPLKPRKQKLERKRNKSNGKYVLKHPICMRVAALSRSSFLKGLKRRIEGVNSSSPLSRDFTREDRRERDQSLSLESVSTERGEIVFFEI